MANTNLHKPLSFAFCYGFVEGAAHGRKLTKLLKKSGFEPADNLASADIIIAHSAGCWLIPANARPKITIYIGMPLPLTGAQKIWLKANWLSLRSFLRKGHVFKMFHGAILNTYYAARHPRRSLGIIQGTKTAEPMIFRGSQTIFIANHHDPWPDSKRLINYLNKEDWAFIGLEGAHNNIWQQPKHYVDIIKHYAELLAKTD